MEKKVIINGEKIIQMNQLNGNLKLSEIHLLLLENHSIREFIGYPESTLIFLDEGNNVDINEDNKCLSYILSNNDKLHVEKRKNNLQPVSLKIDQNEESLNYLPLDVKLNEIRLILNLNSKCNNFGDNYLFQYPGYGKIGIEHESKMMFSKIIEKKDDVSLIRLSKTNTLIGGN